MSITIIALWIDHPDFHLKTVKDRTGSTAYYDPVYYTSRFGTGQLFIKKQGYYWPIKNRDYEGHLEHFDSIEQVEDYLFDHDYEVYEERDYMVPIRTSLRRLIDPALFVKF